MRAAFIAKGRDPDALQVKVIMRPVYRADTRRPDSLGVPTAGDAFADIDATLEQVPALRAAGATGIYVFPHVYCRDSDYERWLDRLVAVQDGA